MSRLEDDIESTDKIGSRILLLSMPGPERREPSRQV